MRYITIPQPIQLQNPSTGDWQLDPDGKPFMADFASIVRAVCLAEETRAAFEDQFDLINIRQKLIDAQPEEVVEVEDRIHNILTPLFKKGVNLLPIFLFSPGAIDMLRAVTDASSSKPK